MCRLPHSTEFIDNVRKPFLVFYTAHHQTDNMRHHKPPRGSEKTRHLIIFHKRKSKEPNARWKLHNKVDKLLLRLDVWYYAATCFNFVSFSRLRSVENIFWWFAKYFISAFIAFSLKRPCRRFYRCEHRAMCAKICLHFHLASLITCALICESNVGELEPLFSRFRWSQTRNNSRDEMLLMPLTLCIMPWVKMIWKGGASTVERAREITLISNKLITQHAVNL